MVDDVGVDLGDVAPVEELHGAPERDEDHVVEVEPEHLPLGLHDADDGEARLANADARAERAPVGEQLAGGLRAEDADGRLPSGSPPGRKLPIRACQRRDASSAATVP